MVQAVIFRELSNLSPGRVRLGESMQKHTSWRIGGPAELFVEPVNGGELGQVIAFAHHHKIPMTVIGAGSNILVSDAGIKGLVIKLGRSMSKISLEGNEITAEAGARLAKVAAVAKEAGLGGFEFSAGIPGAIGGAIVMNAGANGADIGALVSKVMIVDQAGRAFTKNNRDMEFGYRKSVLQEDPAVVAEATFTCYPRDRALIQTETDEYLSKRKGSQPNGCPNAGSVFKNPAGDSAGRLIEAAGLKGLVVGNAQVSTIHANFIVNLGSAAAVDVTELISRIKAEVYNRFSVELQTEIKFAGFQE